MTDPSIIHVTAGATSDRTPQNRRRHRKMAILAVVGLISAGLIGVVATNSFGQGYGPGFGPGFGHGAGFGLGFGRSWGGPGFWHGGPRGDGTFDPAWVETRVDHMIRHLAVELGANAEQQEKLGAIAKSTIKDLLPVREKMVAARRQGRDLLTQPTVDRAALEKLRAEQIATADGASKRLVQALADAAEVLTPEQRKKLDDILPPGGPGGGWGRMGGRGPGMGGHWWN